MHTIVADMKATLICRLPYICPLGSVPTLIITSDGDRELLTDGDIDELLCLHAVSPEDTLHFGANPFPGFRCVSDRPTGVCARAPMLTHAEEFNNAVLDWIEMVT